MNRHTKRTMLVLFDAFAIITSSILSYLFLSPYIILSPIEFWIAILLSGGFYFVFAWYFHFFSKINRYTSIRETLIHIGGISLSFLLATGVLVPMVDGVSLRFMVLTYIFSVALIPGSRVFWRIYQEHQQKMKSVNSGLKSSKVRTLIIGAGDGGSLFIKSLKRHSNGIELVGIADRDLTKQRVFLYGVPVLGTIEDIPNLVIRHDIQQITIAIPTLTTKELNEIVDICTKTNAKVNQMPSIEDVVQGKLEVNKFNDIDVTDLLGREEVKLDMKRIANQLTGKTVLVSGAGGSIGSEVCRQIVRFSPKRILLLGHGENSIYLIHKELSKIKSDETELIPLIADIQDRKRIFSIMEQYKPDQVYHAAAHKHVPLMEYNPNEALKNNIYGTKNMAEGAKAANVESFVMISTDKAVNPPNVMGATKRIAEMIVTGLNDSGTTKFVAVRFGNVLGSRGSVIPLFKEQIQQGGPITITDYKMTRYFMTIPEASRLVLQAGTLAKGGEIFILDMGNPVKILDLAKTMIKLSGYTENDIVIKETGIRPGEKLYEELLTGEENTNSKVFDKIFIGKVTNRSINQVLSFLEEIKYSSDESLRNKLINYANQDYVEEFKSSIPNISEGEENDLSKKIEAHV